MCNIHNLAFCLDSREIHSPTAGEVCGIMALLPGSAGHTKNGLIFNIHYIVTHQLRCDDLEQFIVYQFVYYRVHVPTLYTLCTHTQYHRWSVCSALMRTRSAKEC